MLRLLCALLAGIFVSGLVLNLGTGDPDYIWIWTLGMSFLIFGMALQRIRKSLGGFNVLSGQTVESLQDRSQGTLARITEVKRTGIAISNSPICKLTLVVAPVDRDAYTTTIAVPLDPVDIPRYQPGAVVVVARVKPDRPRVLLVRNPGPGWQRWIKEAGPRIPDSAAAPVWEPVPKSDADTAGFTQIIGTGARGRRMRIAVYLALFVTGAAVVLGPNHSAAVVATQGLVSGGDFDDFVNGNRQAEAVDALVALAGSQFIEVSFHEAGFVSAQAPSAPGAVTIDDFTYRYGEAERTGPTLIQPDDPQTQLFDIGKVDLTSIVGQVDETKKLTGITDPESSMVLIARASPDSLTGAQSPIEVFVSVDDAYYGGWVTFTPEGEVSGMSGGVPGSASYEEEHADD